MTTVNPQTKHQRADWQKFKSAIAQGSKPIISSLYLDDLRRMIMQLWFHYSGNVDEVAYQVDESSVSWNYDSSGALQKGEGDLEISVFDISHNMNHLTVSGTSETKVAGRWLFYKNTENLYEDEIWCDGLYESGQTYYKDDVRFYLGKLFKVIADYSTDNVPITVIKTTPNVQYSEVHKDWELLTELVPCGYLDETNSRVQSKIHFDTWCKNFSGGYKENDCTSWQGGWKATRDIELTETPPHLWCKGGRTDITKTTDAKYEEGDKWQSQVWPKGTLVLDTNGYTVWEALQKVENSTEFPNIQETAPAENAFWTECPDLAIEWEKLPSEYIISTSHFELSPSYNFVHDWSKNSPCTVRHYDSQGTEESLITSIIDCHPSFLFPVQVDPREQYPWICRAYKEPTLESLSGQTDPLFSVEEKFKYTFNTACITNPVYLGAVFNANRWRSWIDTSQNPNKINYYRIGYSDTAGLDFPGNQITNFGGDIYKNVPLSVTAAAWARNPNNNGALQNAINMVLSDSAIRLPITDTYRRNWRLRYFSTTPINTVGSIYYSVGDDTLKKCTSVSPLTFVDVADEEIELFHTHPSVSDAFWGFNESGIELFLSVLGRYDWMFQTTSPYIPAGICFEAERTAQGDNGGYYPYPSAQDCLDGWKCTASGTWRLFHQYTCGRPKWMRSQEMGEPDHYKDTFTPTTFEGYSCLIGEYPASPYNGMAAVGRWFGGYTPDLPTIDFFDDKFETITAAAKIEIGGQWQSGQPYKKWTVIFNDGESYWATQDITDTTNAPASNSQYEPLKYSFVVSGNRATSSTEADNIKVGWMVHLFKMDGEDYPEISDDESIMKTPYVLRVRYDSINDRTYITVSEPVFLGSELTEAGYFENVGWNREISIRHDGFAVDFNLDCDTGEMEYQVYYKLHPQLLIDAYDLLNLALYKEIALPGLSIRSLSITGSYTNATGGSIGSALGQARGLASSLFSYISDPDSWPNPAITPVYSSDGQGNTSFNNIGVAGFPVIATSYTAQEYTSLSPKVKTSSCTAVYNCIAFKISEWTPPLKTLPKKLAIKITLKSLWQGNPVSEFAQSVNGIHNHIDDSQYVFKYYYHYIQGDVGGDWHVLKPEEVWSQYYESKIDNGNIKTTTWNCQQQMNVYEINIETIRPIVTIDYGSTDESYFTDNFFHTDAPRALIVDDKPPYPTPIHLGSSPYVELILVLPYDLENPENVTEWIYDEDYNAADKVFRLINGKKQLYTAKNNIVDTDLRPEANSTEWEWSEPYVELRIYGKCGICKDHENSNPVKYSLLCGEDENLDTEFTAEREKMIVFKNIPLRMAAAGNIYGDSGTKVKLYYSGSLEAKAGDIIELIAGNNTSYAGIYTVDSVGTGYIIFDTHHYFDTDDEGTELTGTIIINRTKTYNKGMWDAELLSDNETLLKDSTFAFQARDSANDVQGVADNYTDIGTYVQLTPPADFEDYWDE